MSLSFSTGIVFTSFLFRGFLSLEPTGLPRFWRVFASVAICPIGTSIRIGAFSVLPRFWREFASVATCPIGTSIQIEAFSAGI